MLMRQSRRIEKVLVYGFLSVLFLFAIFPVFYTVMASFKTNVDILANPAQIFPKRFVLDNYVTAWKEAKFARYTYNSVFITFFTVIGVMITSTVTGYVFARGSFPGKKIVMGLVLSSMFVSMGSLSLFPLLMIAKFLHINNSLWGIIIIYVFGMNVTNVFVSMGFIRTIPKEIDEAAKIDGCGFARIYASIILPLLKPLVATIGILSFRAAWNDYMLPLVFTLSAPARMPLVVGVINLKYTGSAAASWNLMLAGSTLALIPMIIIYIIFSNSFMKGLTSGAVKG